VIRNLFAWLADVLLGPACPGCSYRARGWRTYGDHIEKHPTHDQKGPHR
jgi:hypothetical protein